MEQGGWGNLAGAEEGNVVIPTYTFIPAMLCPLFKIFLLQITPFQPKPTAKANYQTSLRLQSPIPNAEPLLSRYENRKNCTSDPPAPHQCRKGERDGGYDGEVEGGESI